MNFISGKDVFVCLPSADWVWKKRVFHVSTRDHGCSALKNIN